MFAKTKQALINHIQSLFHIETLSRKVHKHVVANEKMQKTIGIRAWVQANPALMMLYSVYESQKPELCQMLPSILQLTDLPLDTRDCIALRYIVSRKKLERFHVEAYNFHPCCNLVGIVAPALKVNMPKQLVLIGLHLQDEEVSALADAVIGTPLTYLCAMSCGITESGAKALSSALGGSRLQFISLSYNQIGDAGLRYVASHLPRTSLTHLELENCGIGDEGIIVLSRILPETNITGLGLGDNHITGRGLRVLAEAIMDTPSFKTLNIWNQANATEEGIKEFLITVTYHPKFCVLLISEKDIDKLHDTIKYVNQERKKLGHAKIIVNTSSSLDSGTITTAPSLSK